MNYPNSKMERKEKTIHGQNFPFNKISCIEYMNQEIQTKREPKHWFIILKKKKKKDGEFNH